MRRLVYAVPVLAFAGIAWFLFASLKGPPPDFLPSALIGKPAPHIALPPLDAGAASFSPRDLAAGHVSVVNVFASWCAPWPSRINPSAACTAAALAPWRVVSNTL